LYLLPVLSIVECDDHIILIELQGSTPGMKREGDRLKQLSNESYFVACYASAHVQGPAAPCDLSRFSEPHCHYYATAPGLLRGSLIINPSPSGTCLCNNGREREISGPISLARWTVFQLTSEIEWRWQNTQRDLGARYQ
jgi:hypothetical protein